MGGCPGYEEVQVLMKRLKVLLGVVAAMAMLLTATSLATASTSIDTGAVPDDSYDYPLADSPVADFPFLDPQGNLTIWLLGYNPCWPVATDPRCDDGGGTQVGIFL